jgi:vesicle coat complex subunit
MHLLSRIGELSEWGLAVVLDIVSRYTPTNEDETFAVMNLLDAVLRTANSGAVLGTIKCFMKMTESLEDLRPQIWARAKPPLLTLLAGGNPELQYVSCSKPFLQSFLLPFVVISLSLSLSLSLSIYYCLPAFSNTT